MLDAPLLTVSDTVTLLGVSESWLYKAVASRSIPHLRVGRLVRFSREQLESWLASRIS